MALNNIHRSFGSQTGKIIDVTGSLNFNVPTTVTLSATTYANPGIYTLFNITSVTNFQNLSVVHAGGRELRELKISGSAIIVTVI